MIKGYLKDLKAALDKIRCADSITDWSFTSKLPERGKLRYMNLNILPDGKAAPFFIDEENKTFAYLFTIVRKEKTRFIIEILVELYFPNPKDRIGGGSWIPSGAIPKRIGRMEVLTFQEFLKDKQKVAFISSRARAAFERASKLSPDVEKMWNILMTVARERVKAEK